VRGGYFAYRMLATGDVMDAARDAGLSATATASLLLSRLSAFYGTRTETRKVLLSTLVPAVRYLAPAFAPLAGPTPLTRSQTLAAARLRQFDSLVREHGGHFIFLVPATLDAGGPAYLQEAGSGAGVRVLVPMAPGALSKSDFGDGFHLNQRGESRYTAALALLLRDEVSRLR
jgi:hypothetical protein